MKIILEDQDSTVMSTFTPKVSTNASYQSEAQLEEEFINILQSQGYEYAHIHNEKDLIANLRVQIEKLNNYYFLDSEWNRFFSSCIANDAEGIAEKTEKIQNGSTKQSFVCDDGETKNICLLDKENIHNNILQVINQYAVNANESNPNSPSYSNRYDVTILVNGLPMVHIELKRRGVPIREAFNQIQRYQRDSFWAESGLFKYVQIFVISNGTHTKYYSNSTRIDARKQVDSKISNANTSINNFEFTINWSDAKNNVISDLCDFTQTFFARNTILNILTKYCVFTKDKKLMVMRPYQITAAERIVNRIKYADNYNKYGSIEGGGYIWHTTGSGKTLTSFKTAQLVNELKNANGGNLIDKVLFVVDRKDLDYQTIVEYDNFKPGCANSNTSTSILAEQLSDNTDDSRLIVTTIQKLTRFISSNPTHEVYAKHIVFIFDECHRSQFGDMHSNIENHFKKSLMFGFTGTPIFEENAFGPDMAHRFTTEQTFGSRLHSYTIIDAINNKSVLPFRVEYVSTVKTSSVLEKKTDELVNDIKRREVIINPKRIHNVTEYILNNFSRKTYRNEKNYNHKIIVNVEELAKSKSGKADRCKSNNTQVKTIKENTVVSGFNSIFAVSDIELAKLYYTEFKKQQENLPQDERLKVVTIFSYSPNEKYSDSTDARSMGDYVLGEENPESTANLDENSREFLQNAINDYNQMFGMHYDTSNNEFQSYYKDVSMRMKNKEIDILIVVNMFLTGFDAKTLNTLWVDKNLRMHGLIQAFSRTNRTLNSIKTFGNIVCFRDLHNQVNKAISLFGDKDAQGIVLCPTFDELYYGYTDSNGKHHLGYFDLINMLKDDYPLNNLRLEGEFRQKEFVILLGKILRAQNMLRAFDEYGGKEIVSERDMQNYLSEYQDLREEWKSKEDEAADIVDDVVFEMELVQQVEVNIDYILALVNKYKNSHCNNREQKFDIEKAIGSSTKLRSKKELIKQFIEQLDGSIYNLELNTNDSKNVENARNVENIDINEEWSNFVDKQFKADLADLINKENLNRTKTYDVIRDAFNDGELKTFGTGIDSTLPAISRFGEAGKRRRIIEKRVTEELKTLFAKYFGVYSPLTNKNTLDDYHVD